MKIEDIADLIHFRYSKKYLKWEYPKNVNKNLLLKYPKIFKYFDSVIMKNEIIGNYTLDFNSNDNKNIFCKAEGLNC